MLILISSHLLLHYKSLAIRDYWSLGEEGGGDDKFVVLVVDEFGGKGNVLNFNVGEGVKFALPNVFWTRLSSKYGTVSGLQFMCFVLCSISMFLCSNQTNTSCE